MESDVVRRLIWSGLLALTGALASIAAHRAAGLIWKQVFDEEPPECGRPNPRARRRDRGPGSVRGRARARRLGAGLDPVREEIELAKTEVTEKVTYLAKGSVVGIAAGVFVVSRAGDADVSSARG